MKSLSVAEKHRFEKYVIYQGYYSLLGRDYELELKPLLRDQGLSLMVWSPLAGGLLSGKYGRHTAPEDGRRINFDFPPVDKEKAFDIIEIMREIATSKEITIPQVALSWLLHQPSVTSVIIGAKRNDQLEDNLKAVASKLSADELARLDEVSKPASIYPGWMIARQGADRK